MGIKKIALVATAIIIPTMVFAAGDGHHEVTMMESDFFYRILNFSVFAGILYYLVANPVKAYFVGRSEGIASKLEEIEEKLQASKNERLVAEENLVKAEAKAKEIVADAENEAQLISVNIAEKNSATLELLAQQATEKQALTSKKATQTTINELLNENFDNADIAVDEAKVVSLVSGKVA